MIYQNLHKAHLQGIGMTQILAYHVGQTTSTTFGCESRGPSQLHGHNPWLVCELGLSWDSMNDTLVLLLWWSGGSYGLFRANVH